MADPSDRALIDEQIAYYRARAGEYDATSTIDDDPFAEQTRRVRAALDAFAPRGRVLELAAGTGQWTAQLADHADELLVTDASPEMLELNRAKVGERPNVRYHVADALALATDRRYDVVFFGFFLSHVPPGRFDAFWATVAGLLAPGGRVFLVDEADHGLWEEDWVDRSAGLIHRRLNDGSLHRAVKVLWRPDELEARLAHLGWRAAVHLGLPFYWGTAERAAAA
jgi:demethylmenaquinone methyltransferase/2-methoxy-6-polyprenyl-1,4-benzoquinol methylase